MEEHSDLIRREDDRRIAEFVGEIRQWKEESIKWRIETDTKLQEIHNFMEDIRTPRKIIVWGLRAVLVAAAGSVVAAITGFIKGHIKIN